MKCFKAYKFRLYPNNEQKTYFEKCFGCARFLYNKMLEERINTYKLCNGDINLLKKAKLKTYTEWKNEYAWLGEVDNLILANVSLNIISAFRNFFKNKGKVGFPKFKKKHSNNNTFKTNNNTTNNKIRIVDKKIRLPKIGFVKLKQHREILKDEKIKSCVVSKTKTGKYFISILVEYLTEQPILELDYSKAIGLDYSSSSFYIDSQNIKAEYPKFYRNAENILKKEQRKLSRCNKGGKNYLKQKIKVAKAYEKTANCRKDWLNKLSKELSKNNDIVCIENLNVKAISNSLKLGKSTRDNSWSMFVEMLERKVKKLIKIDRWFPSSKLCHCCGTINQNLKLGQKYWVCECGSIINRDYNASQNILDEGLRILVQN